MKRYGNPTFKVSRRYFFLEIPIQLLSGCFQSSYTIFFILIDLDPCQKIVCSHYATCKVYGPNVGRCECNEDLPEYEDEICSDDSVTYQNYGFLEKDTCLQKQFIGVKKNGSCERK